MKARRKLVETGGQISMRRQRGLVRVNRLSLDYEPVGLESEELALRYRGELPLEHSFFGSRTMTQTRRDGGSRLITGESNN